MAASEYMPVTSGNERQHLRRDGKKKCECIYLTVLLKSHLYSYRAKLPTGVYVPISGIFKPAENTSHPPDVPACSNVPFSETSTWDDRASPKYPCKYCGDSKSSFMLQHSINFCGVTPGVHQNQMLSGALHLKNSYRTKSWR